MPLIHSNAIFFAVTHIYPNPFRKRPVVSRYTTAQNFACNPCAAAATLSPTNPTTFLALPTEF